MDALKLSHYRPSNYTPSHAAFLVFSAGLMGFQPSFFSLQTVIVIAALFIFKVALVPFLALIVIFYFIGALFLDSFNHTIGLSILNMDLLSGLWGTLSELPIIPLTRFNNSMFMGAFIASIVLAVIAYLVLSFISKRKSEAK